MLYSSDASALKVVTKPTPNLSATAGPAGQGDYHFGVLKVSKLDRGCNFTLCVWRKSQVGVAY